MLFGLGDLPGAIRQYEDALRLRDQLGDPYAESEGCKSLGTAYLRWASSPSNFHTDYNTKFGDSSERDEFPPHHPRGAVCGTRECRATEKWSRMTDGDKLLRRMGSPDLAVGALQRSLALQRQLPTPNESSEVVNASPSICLQA